MRISALTALIAAPATSSVARAEPASLKFTSPVASGGTRNAQLFAGGSIATNANIYNRILNGGGELGLGAANLGP